MTTLWSRFVALGVVLVWPMIVPGAAVADDDAGAGGKLSTDQPFAVNLVTGVEFPLERKGDNKNFSQSRGTVGLRVSNRVSENMRTELLWRLTNVVLEQAPSAGGSTTDMTSEKSLEFSGGVSYALYRRKVVPSDTKFNPMEIAAILRGGGQTSETAEAVLFKTFAGLRFLNTGPIANGAYFDIGYGQSQSFDSGTHRLKIEGLLPVPAVSVLGGTVFLYSAIDAGQGADSVVFAVGVASDIENIVSRLGIQIGSNAVASPPAP